MSETAESGPVKHVLAHRDGPGVVVGILMAMGAACPKCGHGTRVTSKRWAKCKKCGERVMRRTGKEVGELLHHPDSEGG